MNGKMNKAKDNITGTPSSRLIFYEPDINIKNDFKLLYGNIDDVNNYLN